MTVGPGEVTLHLKNIFQFIAKLKTKQLGQNFMADSKKFAKSIQ